MILDANKKSILFVSTLTNEPLKKYLCSQSLERKCLRVLHVNNWKRKILSRSLFNFQLDEEIYELCSNLIKSQNIVLKFNLLSWRPPVNEFCLFLKFFTILKGRASKRLDISQVFGYFEWHDFFFIIFRDERLGKKKSIFLFSLVFLEFSIPLDFIKIIFRRSELKTYTQFSPFNWFKTIDFSNSSFLWFVPPLRLL